MQIIFIGGLHRSGTSLLHRLLRAHPEISGFTNTGAGEDEGQLLQSVYPRAKSYGGPGRFAFDERAHFTEQSSLVSPTARIALLNDWNPHWDLSKPVLIEKSPPNLIRARFLQALFPGAKFIFIVRHPVAVLHSTQKWTKQSESELILHWLVAHDIFLQDLPHVEHWAWFRYEDLVTKPEATLQTLFGFIGLSPITPVERVVGDVGIRHASNYEPRSLERLFQARATLSWRFGGQGGSAAMMEHLGYRLEWPYFRPAPGEGSVITSGQ
jgi:Sulfotransferase family